MAMRNAPAPTGYYTDVEIIFKLKNGKSRIYHWQTPIGLNRALHKAPTWGRLEMRNTGVRGRSQILGIAVEAQLKPGVFKRG